MTVEMAKPERGLQQTAPAMVGGLAAVAEGFWMGAAQAWDVLEPLNLRRRLGAIHPRLSRRAVTGLATRELTIAEASVVLMGSFFLSAVLGAVRQILFNAQIGAGADASAYYAAFRLPDTLFSLIAGGALSSAMIPVLLSTTQDEGERAGWRLTNLVLNALLAVIAIVVLVGEIVAPVFVTHVLAPGFNAHTSSLTVDLTRLMLIQPIILAVGSVATAVLNARNQFFLTAISVASHNIGLIGGILATRAHPALGVYGPAAGVIAGAVIQVLILLPGLRGDAFPYRPVLDLADRRLREVFRLLVPNGLAVGVLYTGLIVDTSFASRASQTAALPALQNSLLLVGLPIALFGQAVGQSAFPRMASYAAAGEWAPLRRTILQALGAVVALSVPTVAVLYFLGKIVVRVLFEHGRFGAPAGALTYEVLVAYAVALPAYVATEVLTRGLISLRDTRTPLLTNTMQVVGRALIMAALIASLGVLAVPRAFSIMATLETLVLAAVLLVKVQRRIAVSPVAEPQPS